MKSKILLFLMLFFLIFSCGDDQSKITERAIEECATTCLEKECLGFLFIFAANPGLQCSCQACR